MKQLKFMLAAATAISLATAAQADDYGNSTDFEAPSVGSYPGSVEGWSVPSDGSNESEIIEDASMVKLAATKYTKKYGSEEANHTKALQVSTAGEPILRYIETNANKDGPIPITVSDTAKVYIDTMVQFTPTPVGEEPEPGADDKLMLYAQEVTNVVGDVETVTTNLFVIASSVNVSAAECPRKYVDTGVVVAKDTWYRLTVEASGCVVEDWEEGTQQLNLFKIWLDGQPVTTGSDALIYIDGDNVVFPSIQGVLPLGDDEQSTPVPATINSVGFAGEGKVDDLVLTTSNPIVDSVDFTFEWTTDGISAVKYAIGDATEYTALADDKTITGLAPEATIKIQIETADWYAVKEGADLEYVASEEAADLDELVKEVTATDVGVTVPEGTPAETVNAALAWAKAANNSPAEVEAASSHFFDNYLLNVADLDVEPQIKIVEIDVSGETPVVKAEVTEADGTTTIKELTSDKINGAIKYKAAAELKDLKNATPKAAIEAGDKFIQVVVE